MEKKFCYKFLLKNKISLNIIQGDLTSQNSNIIVNAANNHLQLGSGVAGAIRKKFGNLVQKKCNEIMSKENKQKSSNSCMGIFSSNKLKNGEVKETDLEGINLSKENKDLRYIFHAVGPIYKDGKHNEAKELEKCFVNSFLLAEKLKMESISFPPISSGIFCFPKDECAEIFFETVKNFVENYGNVSDISYLNEINMVIIDYETFKVFEEKLLEVYDKWKLMDFEIKEI